MSSTSGSNPTTSQDSQKSSADEIQALALDALKEQYDLADEVASEVCNFRDEVAIPSHNELRYAGHHVLQAWTSSGEGRELHIAKAKSHCQRAVYEASDAGIISALDNIKMFKDDYAKVQVLKVVGNYQEIVGRARDAQNLINKARLHSPSDCIDGIPYMNCFRLLVADVHTLDDSREELNKLIEDDKKSGKKWLVMLMVTLLGVMVSASALVFTVINSNPVEATGLPFSQSTPNQVEPKTKPLKP